MPRYLRALALFLHPCRARAKRPRTRRPRSQASLGLSRRAGANAHQTQKPRAGCPARARQPSRPQPPAAPAGRRDSGNRPPAGLPAGGCPSTKSFLRLGCPTDGDRIKTPREPVSSYKRTKTKCSRHPLRRTRHFSFLPRQQGEKAATDERGVIASNRDGRRASRRTKSETSQKRPREGRPESTGRLESCHSL